MKELKCPQCGKVFGVNEADYASIVNQVKSAEFNEELERRAAEINARIAAEHKAQLAKSEQELERRLATNSQQMNEKEQEITALREQLKSAQKVKELEMQSEILKREQAIIDLRSKLENSENLTKTAIMAEQTKALTQLQKKEEQISELRFQLHNEQQQALLRENALKEQHKRELQCADEQVAHYKEMRQKMSTKMVGETLEEHCRIEYENYLRPLMPNASFEKDNEVADGTKGDFIYRAQEDGVEYISIMFEMKNEMETTAAKHKNEDFFKKLDDDRKKKGCEYAVLVSTLESDSELYNRGIVDVSHRYDKMFVVRPQFFVPIITMLTQAAKKTISYQRELVEARNQSIDITNFEEKLNDFKTDVNRNVTLAHTQFEAAIKAIDDSIKDLVKVKEQLTKSGKNLRLVNDKSLELTIRQLTYMNPTMQQMFKALKKNK